MRLLVFGAMAAGAAFAVQAQVRCKMPNGMWIEQRLSASCPSGAQQAQTLDGKPTPLRVPALPVPVDQAQARQVPRDQPVASLESDSQSIPFEACVGLMTRTVLSVGGVNTRVVLSAPDVRMLRICTNDGSVLMTCSRPDGTMVTTRSPDHCR